MSDIVNRINEATNYKILRNIHWQEVIYSFFQMYDTAKSMSMNEKNEKAKAAYEKASNMLDNMQNFVDSFPMMEKLNTDARKESDKLMKMRNM